MLRSFLEFFKRLFGGSTAKPPASSTAQPEDGADVPADSVTTPVPPESIPRVNSGLNIGEPVTATADTSLVHKPRYLWCLDNGHGKATPGKRSPVLPDSTQLMEYELVRDINARIMKALDAKGVKYYNVVPEVEGDIPLQTRTSRANGFQNALPKIYLSIHSNANGLGASFDAANGLETWYLKGSTYGPFIASSFQRELIKATGWKDRGIRCHNPSTKGFFVLRNTSMPAVLTENGFYTNKEQALELQKPDVRQKIADAHVAAILEVEAKGMENLSLYSPNVEIKL